MPFATVRRGSAIFSAVEGGDQPGMTSQKGWEAEGGPVQGPRGQKSEEDSCSFSPPRMAGPGLWTLQR